MLHFASAEAKMATYSADTFTDADSTALGSHTPDTGTIDAVFDSDGFISSNELHASLFGATSALYGPAPASADYSAQAKVTLVGDDSGGLAGVMLRAFDSSGLTGYFGGWDSTNGGWIIARLDSNVQTVLDSNATPDFADDSHVTVACAIAGSALELRVNGDVVVTTTDATYSSTGKGGVRMAPITATRFSLDDFQISDTFTDPGVHVVSGRDVIDIDSPLWLSILLEDIPTNLSTGAAEPPNWYHVGMVSWGTENGTMQAYPVTRELDLVQLPAGMTMLYFEFASGITATITELAAP